LISDKVDRKQINSCLFIYSWSSGPENRRKKHQQVRYQIIRENFENLFLADDKIGSISMSENSSNSKFEFLIIKKITDLFNSHTTSDFFFSVC
jgi:hypothetical protein